MVTKRETAEERPNRHQGECHIPFDDLARGPRKAVTIAHPSIQFGIVSRRIAYNVTQGTKMKGGSYNIWNKLSKGVRNSNRYTRTHKVHVKISKTKLKLADKNVYARTQLHPEKKPRVERLYTYNP